MPLQTSGPISMADIMAELGLPAGTTMDLNDPRIRNLGKPGSGPSGQISFQDFYGKSTAIEITISSSTQNKQMGAEILAAKASAAKIIIPAGVTISSSDAGIPAISFEGVPASTVIELVNHGIIHGKGGAGGTGGGVTGVTAYDGWHGQQGGTAIQNGAGRLTIKNYGTVTAGGGGGGGGGALWKNTPYGAAACAGGGGGGGQGFFGFGGGGGSTSDGHAGNGSAGSTGSDFLQGHGGSGGRISVGSGVVTGGSGGKGGVYASDGDSGSAGIGTNHQTSGGWGGLAGWASYGPDSTRIIWDTVGTRNGPVFVSKNVPIQRLTAQTTKSFVSASNKYATVPPHATPEWITAGVISTAAAPAGKVVNRVEVMGVRTDRYHYSNRPLTSKPWTHFRLKFELTETGSNMGRIRVALSGERITSFKTTDIWPDLQYKLHYSDGTSSDFVKVIIDFTATVS